MEMIQPDFRVFSDQTEIPVYRVSATFAPSRREDDGNCYGIGVIDSDEAVTVEIRCTRGLGSTVILPENAVADAVITPEKIQCRLTRHGTYIFEPQGYKETPLVLFFNPVEKDAPAPDTPGVRYFGPGHHSPGKIELGSDETLYLAAGAVVEASVFAHGSNIRICGHGILSMRNLPRQSVRHCLDFYKCTHLELRDFISTDPCLWHLVLRDSHDVLIDRVKLCGGRMLNDDGIDICNSTDVVIRNCFIRSQDDVIAIKGMDDQKEHFSLDSKETVAAFEPDRRGIRNVLIEDCVFWCDAANVFRYGYECTAETMENITVRNCDIVHICDVYREPSAFWCNTVWFLQPSHRMPIRDLLFEDLRIRIDVPDLVLMKLVPLECPPWIDFGSLRNCTFRNISITGDTPSFRGEILIAGNDPEHTVEEIHLENVTINGRTIDRSFEYLTIGDFTENVTFS